MFFEYGFSQPIWRFSFQIDTGNHSLIYCKPPRYDTHEYEFIQKLVKSMDENGVVREYNVPWISMVFLSAKPHQENGPYHY